MKKKDYILYLGKTLNKNEKIYLKSPELKETYYGQQWDFGSLVLVKDKLEKYGKRFDGLINFSYMNGFRYVNTINENPFIESVLTDKSAWKLTELMNVCSKLIEVVSLFNQGHSIISQHNEYIEMIKDKEMADKINNKILPQLFKEIEICAKS